MSPARGVIGTDFERLFLRTAPLLLWVTLALVYLPSIGGGYLNYDDPWLVQQNPWYSHGTLRELVSIWTRFDFGTRLELGAEYLPLRDTSHWLEARLFGDSPAARHLVNWALYGLAICQVRHLLRGMLSTRLPAELATWVFALHPAHVENVAWIAGRKDVLAMLFVATALVAYDRRRPHFVWVTALAMLGAMLSKSMSVAMVLLLPTLDFMRHRRPHRPALVVAGLVTLLVLGVDLWVGRTVGMMSSPLGGSRSSALCSMGPVWLRYLGMLVWPGALSLVHDVPVRRALDLTSGLGYGVVLMWGLVGWYRWHRTKRPGLWVGFLWFIVPLLPVSQVLVALQNPMADRYLWWSVMAVALLAGHCVHIRRGLGIGAAGLLLLIFTGGSMHRAALFGDSVLVFADATRKTRMSTLAPYQLGQAYEAQGSQAEARKAYELVLARGTSGEPVRRAINNLAKLEGRRGNWDRAEAVLRRGLGNFPEDAKMRDNLRRVLLRRTIGDASPRETRHSLDSSEQRTFAGH